MSKYEANRQGLGRIWCVVVSWTILVLMPGALHAHPAPQSGEKRGYIEAGGAYFNVTSGYGDWHSFYSRAAIKQGQKNVWNLDLERSTAFHDHGWYGAVGWTHTLNPDWYIFVAGGGGKSDFFYPRLRVDAFLNRKLLRRRNLLTTFGAGSYAAQDAHRNNSLFAGVSYYFAHPWIIQSGMHWERSTPGDIWSPSGFVACTYGRAGRQYVIGRVTFGREAYQILAPSTSVVDFPSHGISVTWRRWVTPRWGFNLFAEYYGNPYYRRSGPRLGIFREF